MMEPKYLEMGAFNKLKLTTCHNEHKTAEIGNKKRSFSVIPGYHLELDEGPDREAATQFISSI